MTLLGDDTDKLKSTDIGVVVKQFREVMEGEMNLLGENIADKVKGDYYFFIPFKFNLMFNGFSTI